MGTFQPLGGILPTVLRSVLARQPMSSGKLAFAWRAAVGTAIERATRYERRSDGVLLVRPASREWRRELEGQREIIEARLRSWLGDDFAGLVILSEDAPPRHVGRGFPGLSGVEGSPANHGGPKGPPDEKR